MPYGYGYGYGRGFGFRGASPPWPYVGRGRGGLPRCWYPGVYDVPGPYYPYRGAPSYYGDPAYAARPYGPPVSREEEIRLLKEEAKDIQAELEDIEARIKDLEGEQKGE